MKRFALFITMVALLFSTCITETNAATPESGTLAQKMVVFYLKPDISVKLNGVRQMFKDVNGETVYPIIYNGTAYLPVRAMSALMKEPVEWDGGSKTVYVGKTLSNPVKTTAQIPTNAAITAGGVDIAEANKLEASLVTGYSKADVLVMYDFVIQSFKDSSGITVYPLNYGGTTYLPIRSIAEIMKETITWDGTAKTISIGDGTTESGIDVPVVEKDATIAFFKDIYDREEALYYEASAKITKIKSADLAEKQAIAASASDNYLKAQEITLEVKAIKQKSLTKEEKVTCEKLLEFAESNEYYILLLENIAYLAASDSDYSMMADTFLYFAMEAQTKMEDARERIVTE